MQPRAPETPQNGWLDLGLRVRRPTSSIALPSKEMLAALILSATILFNLALAYVNANHMALGRSHVILAEIFIVGVAFGLCLISASRAMIPWAVVLWILATIFVALSLARQSIELKHIRDATLIPIFISLGIVYARGNIIRFFCVLQSIVLIFVVFEASQSALYADLFNPRDYYINTRGFQREMFWVEGSKLFLSSHRPFDRFWFNSLGFHRISGVFLEPVSLGNWCIVVSIFILTFWRTMSRPVLTFFLISNFIVLVASDGRTATGAIVLMLVLTMLASHLPKFIYFFYLPAVILGCALLISTIDADRNVDDFIGRLAHSVWVLSNFKLPDLLGIDLTLIARSADSGISYFLISQSVFGVVLIWAAVCFLLPATSRSSLVFIHCVCLFIPMSLMVGFSLFSIKTSAPLWFIYGYMQARSMPHTWLDLAGLRPRQSSVLKERV